MVRAFGGSLLALALLLWLWPTPAAPHWDLDLRDIHVHRLNNCVNELKFKVKYRLIPSLTHGHVGPTPGVSYSVAVNARTASGETLIRDFRVMNQAVGSTVSFIVPDAARMCRDTLMRLQYYETVVIHVDSGSEVEENNKDNNVKVKHWGIPHPLPFSLPACYVSASFNPEACR
jgi:hypothetical protein